MNPECATCKFLEICQYTDEKKLLSNYVCGLYDTTTKEVVQARCAIIVKFGITGLRAMLPLNLKEEDKPDE